MSEDFRIENDGNKEFLVSKTLQNLNFILESMGKSIHVFDLPRITIEIDECNDNICTETREEMSIGISPDDLLAESKLNAGQTKAFSTIHECLDSIGSSLFFVNGLGGTGKEYLYRALLANVRQRNVIALATTTSGVAASILTGGRTAHSRFKIPINLHEESYCTISKQNWTCRTVTCNTLIIWDEAPMAKRIAIETTDRSLQDIMGIQKPFGGKEIVLGGEFMQV
ncbi:uncharacterized protein LOC142519774 [Primulina tabacum]|uniref:uncharacterized protein LOC142519774 n=1 Tax=Primulina tabacum TaxID=48773 RepID=UPI003F5AC9FE